MIYIATAYLYMNLFLLILKMHLSLFFFSNFFLEILLIILFLNFLLDESKYQFLFNGWLSLCLLNVKIYVFLLLWKILSYYHSKYCLSFSLFSSKTPINFMFYLSYSIFELYLPIFNIYFLLVCLCNLIKSFFEFTITLNALFSYFQHVHLYFYDFYFW